MSASPSDDWTRASSARRRWGWALVALLLVGGGVAPTVARVQSPRLAAGLAVCEGYVLRWGGMRSQPLSAWSHGRDAWGSEVWIYEVPGAPSRIEARSFGPDRKDDQGGGDDLVLTARDITLASAIYNAPWVSGLLAAALAWCLRSRLARAPRHPSRPLEAARALTLALPPALLVLAALRALTWGDRNFGGDPLDALLDERAWPALIVPPPVAFLLAYAAVAFGAAYAWRLTRPAASA